MMRFAAIADIHGNTPALEAVLADIRAQGIGDIVNLGDMASGPLDARRTMDILLDLDATSVQGNHDRWLINREPDAMGAWEQMTYRQLDPRHLEWLKALPMTTVFREKVFLCHATPQDDNTYWLETVTSEGAVTLASLESIEPAAAGIEQSLILCGHTHIPRAVRLRDGRMIVNPGSVGIPGYRYNKPYAHVIEAGTPDAAYAILELRGGEWHVTFRLVPYDHGAMAELARQNGQHDLASAIATGWVR